MSTDSIIIIIIISMKTYKAPFAGAQRHVQKKYQ